MVEARSQEKQTLAMKANVLINGIFHGLALDGIPTLMPGNKPLTWNQTC